MENNKDIYFVHSVMSRSGLHVSLLPLPGQSLKGEAVSAAVEVTGRPSSQLALRQFWKSYPVGTVFAAEGLRFERRSGGGRYEVRRLYPVTETPFSMFDAPDERITKAYQAYVESNGPVR